MEDRKNFKKIKTLFKLGIRMVNIYLVLSTWIEENECGHDHENLKKDHDFIDIND